MPKILVLLAVLAGPFQEKKLAAPDPAALKDPEKLVHEVFKDDYAKKAPADRSALAERMVSQARETKGEPAMRFVLFREAQDSYAQAGELAKALDTIDELFKEYAIDAVSMKMAAITTAGKSAKTPEEVNRVAAGHLRIAGDALQADQYDVAEKAIQAALGAAKRTTNTGLAVRAQAKGKEIADLKARFEKLKKSRETLAANPEDGAANFSVGQFQAAQKGFWEEGLPLLAKGSDAAYRAAATNDLAGPPGPPEQAAVGDAWWDLGEKETGMSRENLRTRAIFWYEKTQNKLTGLPQTKVDKRLTEVRMERLNRGTWVDISDPKLYGKNPPLLEVSTYVTTLERLPPGAFDGLMIRAKFKGDAMFQVVYEPKNRDMEFDTTSGHFSAHHLEGNLWKTQISVPSSKKEEVVLAMLIVEGECVYYLDGREAFRQKSLNDHVLGVQFYAWNGKIQFEQVKLRKKD